MTGIEPSSILPDQGRPDPSRLSSEAIVRAVSAERDYQNGQTDVLRARLNGMDEATRVLHETVTRTPTDIQKAITHLQELHSERFSSVETQFKERDTRGEREARDNKLAVDAAFAAQEKQAAAQDVSNKEAINKSEKSTAETIKTNQELGKATTDALTKSLDEVKLAVAQINAGKQGGKDTLNGIYALAGFLVSLLLLGGFLVATGAFNG
jgi:cation transport regulator ChaB